MAFLNRRTQTGLVAVAGLLLITLLAGCAAPAATPTAAPPAAPTAVPPTEAPAAPVAPESPTAVPATLAPTEAPTSVPPTAAPTEAPTAAPTQAPAAATVSFAKDILPLFEQSCLKCHGGDDTKEGLSVKTYEDLMKGSVNGPVIVPGDPAASELVTQVARGKMPKRAPAWPENQVKLLSDWVAAGALKN